MRSIRLLAIFALISLSFATQVTINFGYAPQNLLKKQLMNKDDLFFQIAQQSVQQVNTLEKGQLVSSATFAGQSSAQPLSVIVSTLDSQTTVPLTNFDCTSGTLCSSGTATKALSPTVAVNAFATAGVSPIVSKGEIVQTTVTFGNYVSKDTSVLLEAGQSQVTSGVLGLGVSSGFLTSLKSNNLISKKLFAFYFSNTLNFATLGNYESYLISDALNYYDVTGTDGLWRVSAADVSTVVGKTVTPTQLKAQTAVWDTTIQGLRAPLTFWNDAKVAAALHTHVTGSTVTFNCNGDVSSLPTLQWTFGQQTYSLEPSGYAKLQSGQTCTTLDENAVASEVHLGRSFMTKYYSVFDLDNKRLGLATATTEIIENFQIDSTTQWCVIVLGLLLILVSFVALLAIMKPLEKRQSLQKKQSLNVENEQQVTKSQNAKNSSQANVNRQNVSPLRQQVQRPIQSSQWNPQQSLQQSYQPNFGQPQVYQQPFQSGLQQPFGLQQSLNRSPIRQ